MENKTNQIQQVDKFPVKTFFQRDFVKKKFEELLGKRSTGFVTSVLQIVSSNSYLQKATPESIFNAACIAATLDLPINNNLGFAYIVPYNQEAQFQMGYKGYIQLAQRSGFYKTIAATPIYEGQLIEENPLNGFEFDFTVKKTGEPIGFAAYIRLLNGFEKTFYLSRSELLQHAGKYSQSFKKNSPKMNMWKDDFEAMAIKTVLKLLISKYGPMSVDMQTAQIADQSVIKNSDTLEVSYIDNLEPEIDHEVERATKLIERQTSIENLETLLESFSDELKIELHPVIENHRIFIIDANGKA